MLSSWQRISSNRLVLAALAAIAVWLADQPTVQGYNPLIEMLWEPGLGHLPAWDWLVLIVSWFVTTIFCHFLIFAVERLRRGGQRLAGPQH